MVFIVPFVLVVLGVGIFPEVSPQLLGGLPPVVGDVTVSDVSALNNNQVGALGDQVQQNTINNGAGGGPIHYPQPSYRPPGHGGGLVGDVNANGVTALDNNQVLAGGSQTQANYIANGGQNGIPKYGSYGPSVNPGKYGIQGGPMTYGQPNGPHGSYGPSNGPYGSYGSSNVPHGNYEPSNGPYGSYGPSNGPYGNYGPPNRPHGNYGSPNVVPGNYGSGSPNYGPYNGGQGNYGPVNGATNGQLIGNINADSISAANNNQVAALGDQYQRNQINNGRPVYAGNPNVGYPSRVPNSPQGQQPLIGNVNARNVDTLNNNQLLATGSQFQNNVNNNGGGGYGGPPSHGGGIMPVPHGGSGATNGLLGLGLLGL